MPDILNAQIALLREQTHALVTQLLALTSSIGHPDLQKSVSEILKRINDPYMFVVVGEVKAGKSSFINALLETETDICKVAPTPMTDTIQQIIYGDREQITEVNPYLKVIAQPVPILREIAIVDTPGTNTIIEHHQEITERFIPISDLIIFVFEAKNPYRQSAWEFFDYIHSDWRKKIIFVLQQKDLLPESDLAINLNGVQEQAIKKGIPEPLVYAVSAKEEQEGRKAESGFSSIREMIQNRITGGKAPILKMQSHLTTAGSVAEKITAGIATRREQFESDRAFREDVRTILEEQKENAQKQVDLLVENLLANYDAITRDKEDSLSAGLSFAVVFRRSFSAVFNKKSSLRHWLSEFATGLEEDFKKGMEGKLNASILSLAESIQQMATIIDLKIRSSKTVLKDDHEMFSDIAQKRSSVLTDLKETFTHFLSQSENFADPELFPQADSVAPNVATGSGIAVVGVILATVTNGMVFDITGGVLTTIGILFAGVSLGLQKRKLMKRFRSEIQAGRNKLELEISTKLKTYVEHLQGKIDGNFAGFDQMLAQEKDELEKLHGAIHRIAAQNVTLTERAELLLNSV